MDNIFNKAKEILVSAGTIKPGDYYSDTFCVFKYDNISISCDNLKGDYSFLKNYDMDILEIERKKKETLKQGIQSIDIYVGRPVYNSKEGLYIRGNWEELIDLLYRKRDRLGEEIHSNELLELAYKKYYLPFHRSFVDTVTNIGNNCYVKKFVADKQGRYGVEQEIYFQVFCDNNKVFEVEELSRDKKATVYKPGKWERQLLTYNDRKRAQEMDSSVANSIKKLKKL